MRPRNDGLLLTKHNYDDILLRTNNEIHEHISLSTYYEISSIYSHSWSENLN